MVSCKAVNWHAFLIPIAALLHFRGPDHLEQRCDFYTFIALWAGERPFSRRVPRRQTSGREKALLRQSLAREEAEARADT